MMAVENGRILDVHSASAASFRGALQKATPGEQALYGGSHVLAFRPPAGSTHPAAEDVLTIGTRRMRVVLVRASTTLAGVLVAYLTEVETN